MSLSLTQSTRARGHLYQLLSRLYLEGLQEELLSYVRAMPELAAALPQSFDADESAADYQQLFGFNVFPYECIFLDPSGLLGGPVTEGVLRSYGAAGYEAGGDTPDHIGHELALLGHLSAAEADAWEDGLERVAGRMARLQGDFLARHLLRWLAPLVLAIRGQGQPFYSALADLTAALVADHAAQFPPAEAVTLPQPPPLVDDPETGLRDINAYLLTPPHSGLYLGRGDITRLARALQLARGFGDRRQMLQNLIRGAAGYDRFISLLDLLRQRALEWQSAYGALPGGGPWAARAGETVEILGELGRQAGGEL